MPTLMDNLAAMQRKRKAQLDAILSQQGQRIAPLAPLDMSMPKAQGGETARMALGMGAGDFLGKALGGALGSAPSAGIGGVGAAGVASGGLGTGTALGGAAGGTAAGTAGSLEAIMNLISLIFL